MLSIGGEETMDHGAPPSSTLSRTQSGKALPLGGPQPQDGECENVRTHWRAVGWEAEASQPGPWVRGSLAEGVAFEQSVERRVKSGYLLRKDVPGRGYNQGKGPVAQALCGGMQGVSLEMCTCGHI